MAIFSKKKKVTRPPAAMTGRLYKQDPGPPQPVRLQSPTNNHHFLGGKSGMGKSSLAELLALEDIYKGHSVVYIDTHYSSYKKILHACIQHNVNPYYVVPIDLTDTRFGSPRLWLLDHSGYAYGAVDGLLSAFRDVPHWKASYGERMADVQRHEFMAFQKSETSLDYLNEFLTKPLVRKSVLEKCNDSNLESYFEHLYKMRDASMIIESSRNKFSQLVSNPLIRPLIDSTKSSFSFYDKLNEGSVILINLSQKYFKDESRAILGSIFMFLIYQAVIERENLKDKTPISLYLDEFHEYATAPFYLPYITAARKYGVGCKMMSQNLVRFERKDLEIILGNVGLITSFAMGNHDAKLMIDEMFPFFGEYVKKWEYEGYDAYGGYGYKEDRYSTGDERLNALNEIMNQMPRENYTRIIGTNPIQLWQAYVSDELRFDISQKVEDEYLRECARYHYSQESPLKIQATDSIWQKS
jgi:hypothetical protein